LLLASCCGGVALAAVLPACQEGQTDTKGPYWYKCVSGTMQPAGCSVLKGTKQIKLGDTYRHDDYEYQCFMDSDGRPWEKLVACWFNGQRLTDGQTGQAEKSWYQCTADGNGLRLQIKGCVADGRRLDVDERFADAAQGVWFQCKQEPNGAMAVCAIGCVIGGQPYLIGQSYVDGYKHMVCNAFGRLCRGMLIGCVDTASGQQYAPTQTFVAAGGQLTRCDIIGNDIALTLLGCADGSATASGQPPRDALVNEQWRSGTAPTQYQWTCVEDDQGKAGVRANLCIYADTTLINPGCYQLAPGNPKLAVGCQKQTDAANTLKIVTFAADLAVDATAQSFGLSPNC